MQELLGKRCSFIPNAMNAKWVKIDGLHPPQPVRGVIEYVNEEHGWFRITWYAGGTEQHECFKECDIGTAVTLIGHKKDR